MIDDYRNTVYCPQYSDIGDKKKKLVEEIRKKHPRANDMHAIIHPNDGVYKDDFMNIYNHKCAYCGVQSMCISNRFLKLIIIIYENQKGFQQSRCCYIENLILAWVMLQS